LAPISAWAVITAHHGAHSAHAMAMPVTGGHRITTSRAIPGRTTTTAPPIDTHARCRGGMIPPMPGTAPGSMIEIGTDTLPETGLGAGKTTGARSPRAVIGSGAALRPQGASTHVTGPSSSALALLRSGSATPSLRRLANPSRQQRHHAHRCAQTGAAHHGSRPPSRRSARWKQHTCPPAGPLPHPAYCLAPVRPPPRAARLQRLRHNPGPCRRHAQRRCSPGQLRPCARHQRPHRAVAAAEVRAGAVAVPHSAIADFFRGISAPGYRRKRP